MMSSLDLVLFTDGGSRHNPGPSAAAYILQHKDGRLIEQRGIFLGETTNNVAEYEALRAGLQAAQKYAPAGLECFLDSELVVRQLQGVYRVKEKHLLPLYNQTISLACSFPKVTYTYIARENNRPADRIVNQTLDEHQSLE